MMNFTIDSKTLLARLLAAGKAVNSRPSIAILSSFLLELHDTALTVTATDLEKTVVSTMTADSAEGGGRVCVDVRRVTELLKAMPQGPVRFDVADDLTVTISYARGRYKLMGYDAKEYPDADESGDDMVGTFTMPSQQLLAAIDKVGFAVGTEELRPQLHGVFWDITEDAITFVATDTRVLAKYRSTRTAPGLACSFILPSHAFGLVRAFTGKEPEAEVRVTCRAVTFSGPGYKVRTARIKGVYPNYNRVIPVDQPITVTADRPDLADAVGRVSLCSDSSTPLMRLRIADETIHVTARDASFNVGGEERVACKCEGGRIEIGFNPVYLGKLLGSLATKNVVMKFSDSSRPAVFLPSENDEHGELTLLCMPMTISASEE